MRFKELAWTPKNTWDFFDVLIGTKLEKKSDSQKKNHFFLRYATKGCYENENENFKLTTDCTDIKAQTTTRTT